MDWILGILATSLGGINIFQFVYYKTQRDKLRAEADTATTEAITTKCNEIALGGDSFGVCPSFRLNFFLKLYVISLKLA